jgi:hypothetical protein
MNRRTFVTLIPFLPALLKLQPDLNPNQIHIEAIKRESARLKELLLENARATERLREWFKSEQFKHKFAGLIS